HACAIVPGLDPSALRAGLHTAREVISGRQISYPVPYLAVILACLCAACLVIAMLAADAVRIVALVIACIVAIFLIGMIAYALIVRDNLLRSERHEQVTRLIDIAGDKDTAPDVRDRVSQTLVALAGPNTRIRDLRKEDDSDEP